MILGLGTDLVEVYRIATSISTYGDRFIRRVFTESERTYCERKANAAERFAARFAAKEAGMKALGTGLSGGVAWTHFEVTNDAAGKPNLELHSEARQLALKLGVRRIWLSLTHTDKIACATVIFED